ncbi:hypothetical protein ACFQ48_18150 [Hymenobacter caeli]|uniref:SMI1/KNR4 family protein n=1 Tax=Hymenobacter caeli TaxID=2735894 RepID=A0ABX2FX57_9BACT|nr:hypothetical protein [Hymenobacter caeli]NRT20869.1 hypothetical protein [Hymenobacter caeli]
MVDFDPHNERNQTLLAALDFNPPADYLSFVASNNIIYNDQQYSYLSECGDYLCAVNELIKFNLEYNNAEIYTGYFLIGSDGCDEAYAIEKTTGYFVKTPFIGHDDDTPIVVGQTWPEFQKHLYDNAA